VDNAVLYTGRTWDPALGLYDYRNRQYDPALGRFTTPDPLGPNADWNNLGNPYTYTAANPGAFVDPYGYWAWDADLIELGLGGLLGFQGREATKANWASFAEFGAQDYENMEALVSFVPVVGIPADIDLARKDLQRGDYVMATIGIIGIVPIVGDLFQAAAKGSDAAVHVARAADDLSDAAKGIAKAGRKLDDASGLARKRLPSPPPKEAAQTRYEYHHIFPQRSDLAAEFAKRGIDIDAFTMRVPKEVQSRIHGGAPRGGKWNEAWEDFFRTNPEATDVDVYKHAGELIYQFELPATSVVSYPR